MNSRSEEKILCPWCGAEMRMEVYNDCAFTGGRILGEAWRAFYRCHLCGAQGPEETRSAGNKAEEAARAAALRRYTPPMKPLTREDIMQVRYEAAAFWIEFVGTYKEEPACHWYLWSGLLGYSAHVVGYCEPWFLPMADYGKTWRCWERRPTDEERSEAEWET